MDHHVTGASTDALDRLAARCGIESSFRDAAGEIQVASAETKRLLIEAMGMEAGDDAAARRSLAALDRAEWEHPLPPVIVLCRSGTPQSVIVTLPADTGGVTWQVLLESGTRIAGNARFATLEFAEGGHTTQGGRERRRLNLPVDLPYGYHELTIEPGDARCVLIMSPGRCWLPASVHAGQRLWGVSAQLYLLRSNENWGIGDYSDLLRLASMLIPLGVSVLGLNPLHAMFLDDPEHASPYSPASRLLLNVLNIDVTAAAKSAKHVDLGQLLNERTFSCELAAAREAKLVDYANVADLKLTALRLIFAGVRSAPESAGWAAFVAWRGAISSTLTLHILFLALREHFSQAAIGRSDWHEWPLAFRDPGSAEVTEFATNHSDLVTFHAWLQYEADRQLATVAGAASPMAIGLYRDLAVGADRSGAETWANQTAVVAAARIGAPPDLYNPAGQNWGLPPFNPRTLRAEAYKSFIELIRANMRHAGGLRIDHVMALQHLYWVPDGAGPADGAYVQYPLADLVGILALESERNRCLVVGEDLGTVPEGFREHMTAANILSYRVLFFEKNDDGFIAPPHYPRLAIAVEGSHDLPTLRAWWNALDLDLKEALDLFPQPDNARVARDERRDERNQLIEALRSAGLADEHLAGDRLFEAAHAFLARTTSAIALVQLDDITDESSPVNVPTTSDEHPNWRRRLAMTLDELECSPRLKIAEAQFRLARGMPP